MHTQHGRRRQGMLLLAVFSLVRPCSAIAHEGPPYPILMNAQAAGYVVSVWADPDIGKAEFYIIVESPDGKAPSIEPAVSMWVEPTSGRLPRAPYETHRQSMRNRLQFKANPLFDQRDQWKVGILVQPPGGQAAEVLTEVESTPPGFGPWDLAIYFAPFALVGGLWVIAMMSRRRQRLAGAASSTNRDT